MNRALCSLVLALGACGLVGACSAGQREQAARDAQKALSSYCSARQKAIEALGEAGAP